MEVHAKCSGDENVFWFKVIVSGREVGRSVPVASIEAFSEIEFRLNATLNALYQKGKQDGAREARNAIKVAIGI